MAIKYKWLAERLRERIERQKKEGLEQLPTELELCKKYHVSRQTVRAALALLTSEGLIEKRRGSGSYLTGRLPESEKNTVGILISNDEEYIYPALLNDIQTTLARHGFTGRVYVTENSWQRERGILQELLSSPLRGLIVEGIKSSLPNPNADLYRRLKHQGVSFVFLHNFYRELIPCACVKDDNSEGSRLLVRHLIQQGHQAIAGIFRNDDLQGTERFQGFAEALMDAGLSLPDGRLGWFSSRDLTLLEKQGDTAFLKAFIRESLPGCTAVVCYNDTIASLLIRELRLLGYRPPHDMAVASFDNSYMSTTSGLTITSVSHQPHEVGIRTALLLIDQLKGLPARTQEVPWILHVKESTSHPVNE